MTAPTTSGWDLPTVDAGLLSRADGGPVRLRRNGRQPKAVGLYFSVKAGRHLPYESKLELHDLWRAETDSEVVRAFPQPFTFKLVRGGELTRYTPDRLDVLADGSRRVVEVKEEPPVGDALARFGDIVDACAARGLRFEVRTRLHIRAEPSFSGVEAIQRHRRTRLDAADAMRLAARLSAGAVSFGELAAYMAPGPAGSALICAAVVRRLVRIELHGGLHAGSSVELVK